MGIKDLAKQLNLSIATVSRALNSSGPVNPETRQRVIAAAAAAGYSPNISAGSLRKGRIDTIGLLLPMYTHGESHSFSLFMGISVGVRSVLSRHQFDLALFQSNSPEDETTQLRRIVERRQVAGLIIADTQRHDPRLDYLAETSVPFLAFGRSQSGGDHPWLDLDFESAAAETVARLVKLNHQRIAVVLPGQEAMQSFVYLRSYKQALKNLDVPECPELIRYTEFSERGGYQATEALLKLASPPTAIIFLNDCMAIGAYLKLNEAGLTPGRDMAISTGLLTTEVPDYLSPRLTGYTLSRYDLGVRMGEAIIAQIPDVGDAYNNMKVQELWPLQLKARASDTEPPGRRTP